MNGRLRLDTGALGAALRQDLDTVARTAPLPPSALVWFRAERRAKAEALKKADRPIWLAERVALVGAGVVLGWLGSVAWPAVQALDMTAQVAAAMVSAGSAATASLFSLGLALLCAGAVAAGVYVAASGD